MFQPVSRIPYLLCAKDKQVLVCVVDPALPLAPFLPAWKDRAVALFHFTEMCDVFRDVLGNPQIRAVVLMGPGDAFRAAWTKPIEGLPEEHLGVVRQFVDLYDEDCGIHGPLPPFWPERLVYACPDKYRTENNDTSR